MLPCFPAAAGETQAGICNRWQTEGSLAPAFDSKLLLLRVGLSPGYLALPGCSPWYEFYPKGAWRAVRASHVGLCPPSVPRTP